MDDDASADDMAIACGRGMRSSHELLNDPSLKSTSPTPLNVGDGDGLGKTRIENAENETAVGKASCLKIAGNESRRYLISL